MIQRIGVKFKLDCETNCRKSYSYDKRSECSTEILLRNRKHLKRRKWQQKPWLKQERELFVPFAVCREICLYEKEMTKSRIYR